MTHFGVFVLVFSF